MSQTPVMHKPEKSETFIATANADGSKRKVEARAGMAEMATGNDTWVKGHGKVMTVGGEAQLSKEYTGLGVEATYVEAGADFGGVGGVKFGISADSGVGVGSKGLTAKVLGTGVKADETGVEVTILGSGVKVGKLASPWHWFKK